MDEKNKKTFEALQERFNNLPTDIQEAITSNKYKEALFNLVKKFDLNLEEAGHVELNTTMVMLGAINPDKFRESLAEDLQKPSEIIDLIVNEVNTTILQNIRERLKANWEKEQKEEADFIEGRTDIINGVDVFKDENSPYNTQANDEKILETSGIKIETENSTPIAPSNLPVGEDTNKTEENILESSGIKVEPLKTSEAPSSPLPERNTVLKNLENPPKTGTSFLGMKMNSTFGVPKTDSEYKIDPLSKNPTKPNPTNDPYREPIGPDEITPTK